MTKKQPDEQRIEIASILSARTKEGTTKVGLADEPPVCPECDGRGKILDAPDRVLDGRPYWTPCPVCGIDVYPS